MRLHLFHQKARLSAASALDQLRCLLAKSAEGTVTHQLDLSELEDRILLSASPAAVMAESATAGPESVEVASPLESSSSSLFETTSSATAGSSSSDSFQDSGTARQASSGTLPEPSTLTELDEIASSILSEHGSPAERAATEVVFIDDSAANFEQLIADLEAQRDAGRTIDFFVLDTHSDGIDQIAETLERYSDLNAVHIVSHGESGAVKLGATWLRVGSLDGYAGAIAGWGSAFSAEGDILFYGCDLASNTRGEMLVDSIAALTGADVAASTDGTGHAMFGGDWELEYETGRVDSEIVFTEQAQQEWVGKLAVINVTTTDDVVDSGDGLTSLREAIIQANAGSGGDTISLSAGTYTLSISGTGENDAATGDLDIREDVIIRGAGQQLTIINANGIDRVFEVHDNSAFTLEDLTVAGGSTSDDGAGVEAEKAGSLTATRVIFTGNASGKEGGAIRAHKDPVTLTDVAIVGNTAANSGGGIHAEGVTTLTRVTISGNTAAEGAGIYQKGGSSDFTLTNVTISGNVASGEGGGIWTDHPMSITNSTIAFNVANDGAGLYIDGSSGNLTLRNSILADNEQLDSQPDNVTTNNGGLLTSLGFNISSDDTAGLSGPNDLEDTDPLISPTLSLNGGTTETHALQPGSPAINAGTTTGAPATDQRGITRDANPDIGAFEFEATTLTPVDEFRVNNVTGNTQETSNEDRGSSRAVAIAPNGEYVVVWSSNQNSGSDGDGFGVRMQRFDATGNEIGSERQVNTQTNGDQFHASVAIDGSGRGVVVWTEAESGTAVRARLFNANDTFNGGEFAVNTTTTGDQNNAAVAMDAAGNFVVVWEGNGPGDSSGIFAQRFDSNGSKTGSEFRVNNTTIGNQSNPSVAMNAAGQFAVTWADGSGVHARTYEADGTGGSGSQFNVDSTTSAGNSDVGIDETGRMVVVWRDSFLVVGQGVYRRVFEFDGSALTGSDIVNSQVLGDQTDPSITIDAEGNHIVAWEGAGFSDSSGVMYQKYDSTLTKVGGEADINQTTSGTQNQVSLAMLDLDNFVAVWSGEGPGDTTGVFARQFGTAGAPNSTPIADAGGPYSIAEGSSLNLDASGSSDPDSDPLTYMWDLDNDGNFGEPGEPTTETPTVSWTTLQMYGVDDDGVYTIGLRVDDGRGGVDTTTTTLTVTNVAPSLTATGASTVESGSVYTLNLGATDPGADTITSWTINWGDGTIETIAGNPSSANHTYSNRGFTNNITVSATDEDGTYTSSDLLLTSNATSSLFRFDGTDGSLVSEFAIASGLVSPVDIEVGPDGLIYATGFSSDDIRRYDATTGAFVDTFVTANSGGLDSPSRMAWGSDGHLYVTSLGTDEVLRYDGTSGAFIDAFVSTGSGGLDEPDAISFGPDGNLYVSGNATGTILEFDGTSGAFAGTFATFGSTGFTDMTFGPDGHLYVSNVAANTVQRFDGDSGAFIDTFVSSGSGGINGAAGLGFGPDGQLYVVGFNSDGVFRYDGSNGTFLDVFVPAGSGQDQPINLTFLPAEQVTVLNGVPTADAGGPYSITEGDPVSLVGSASSDPDSDTLTYAWDLDNDGNFGEAGEPTTVAPTVSWATLQSFGINGPGDFTIGLQVSDGNGGVDTATTSINVQAAPVVNSDPVAADDAYAVDEGATLNVTVTPNWFNANWSFRQELSLDNSAQTSNLIDYPILVKLHASAGDAINVDYAQIQDAGEDLRFVDSDGTTVLAHEIELWDEAGYSYVWVNVPQIDGASSSDSIFMYYGNPAADDGQVTTSVWNTGERAVLHLNTTTADSTLFDNDGAVDNVFVGNGIVAGAAFFNGTSGDVNLGSDASIDDIFADGGTISAWINPSDWGENGFGRIADKANTTFGGNGDGWAFQVSGVGPSGNLRFEQGFTSSYGAWTTSPGSLSLNTWQHVVITYDSSSAANDPRIFINGVEQSVTQTQTPSGTVRSDAALEFTIGNYSLTQSRTFDGVIDEFRVSSNEETPDEIAAQYDNVAGTFVSSAGVVTGPDGLLNNDADPDSNVLTVSLVSGPSQATSFTLNADGSFSYEHDGSEFTTDSFVYQIDDGQGGTDTATVNLTINPQNDPPTDISLDNSTVDENAVGAVIGDLTTTDPDIGDTHTYIVDDTRFEVVAGQLKLKAGQSLDFETEPTVAITVTSTDSATASVNKPFTITVNDVNEAPSVSLSQTSASLAEDADTTSAIVLASISISDDALGSNSLMLSGADAASFEIVGGNLRLKAATPLDFESRSSYAVTVQVNDPLVGSNPDDSANFTLTITDVNEAPVVTTSAGTVAFTEDAGAVAIDSGLTASDPEGSNLVSAEVRFDSGFVAGQDDLLFTNQSGISGSYNASSGILTLSGPASVAAYETALRSVTYSNSSQNPNTGNRILRFTVNEGVNTAFATRTLTVTAQDDPANAVPGGPYFVAEGDNVTLDGSISSDVDNTIVAFEWDFNYDGVTFSAAATGSTTAFSATSIDGPDTRTIALRTRSDNGVFALATTTVTVTNVAPTANPDSGSGFSTSEDTAFVTASVLSNDSDPGPEALTVTSLNTTGTIGLVTDRGDGTFTYDPNGQFESLTPGQTANDTFTYTVSDGNASDTTTVTIVVTGANDVPITADQIVSLDENAALNTLVATAVASDVDTGDSVSWSIASGNTNGAFTIDASSGQVRVVRPLEIDFESNPSFSLTVRATDQNGGSDTGVITISLNDLNESPTVSNAVFSISEDDVPNTSLGFVPGSDPDAGDSLTWSILSGNTNGSFLLNAATGELTVANPSTLDFETTPSYTLNVQARDDSGLTDTATVVVNVQNVNEAPVTSGLSDVVVNEDSADVLIDLTAAFSDVETPSAALSYSVVTNSNPALFTATPVVGGNLILKFAPNSNGVAALSVRATDPQGLFVTASFNVTVNPTSDSPISNPDSYVVLGDDITVAPAAGVLANDVDPDGDPLTALLITGPDNGSLVLLSNGGFTYTPNAEFQGIDTFVYQPFDGTSTGPARTVTLNVTRAVAPPSSSTESSESSESSEASSETESSETESTSETAESSLTDSETAVANNVTENSESEPAQTVASADDDAEEELAAAFTTSGDETEFFSGDSQRLDLRDATSVRIANATLENSTGSSSVSDNSFRNSLRFDGEDLSYLVSTDFIEELEQVEGEFTFDGTVPEWAAGTAVATTTGLSVGYIVWMLRGGYVLASVLSTMPVWQNIDPLPVLAALDAADDDDDESLETMIDRASEEADDSETQVTDEVSAEEMRKEELV